MHQLFTSSVIYFIIFIQVTTADNQSGLIGGGFIANIENFPWQLYLEHSPTGVFCGGSLISSRYGMTAAHCFNDKKRPTLIICAASSFREYRASPENFTTTSAIKVINHPKYRSGMNDIAVILFKDRIEFSKSIRPIYLPFSNINNLDNVRAYVAGYGLDLSERPTDALYYLYVQIASDQNCDRLNPYYDQKQHICVQGINGRGVCHGDSGSALLMQYKKVVVAIGLVSYGIGGECFEKGTTEVFTRVQSFVSWILNVTSAKINN